MWSISPGMSQQPPQSPSAGSQDFRAAFAQWRLAVHTEVKRASSLPTAMFDATDPMLEMRLCETTESLLAQLHKPPANVSATRTEGELRLEKIEDDELRKLPGLIADRAPVPVDLLADLGGEYIAVLADACCADDEMMQARAAMHMCTDFGITAETLDDAMNELRQLTQEVTVASDDDGQGNRIATVLERVAAVLRAHVPTVAEGGDPS